MSYTKTLRWNCAGIIGSVVSHLSFRLGVHTIGTYPNADCHSRCTWTEVNVWRCTCKYLSGVGMHANCRHIGVEFEDNLHVPLDWCVQRFAEVASFYGDSAAASKSRPFNGGNFHTSNGFCVLLGLLLLEKEERLWNSKWIILWFRWSISVCFYQWMSVIYTVYSLFMYFLLLFVVYLNYVDNLFAY